MANRLSKTIAILLRIAFGFAISLLVIRYVSQHAHAAEFEGLQVEVIGQGRPVLMIPGLNSAGSVWTETCAALQPQVQCHIVQLPGFAGLAPVSADPWLPAMRDRLLRYSAQLKSPSIVGHSLGGLLGLQLVLAEPGRFERLVIVDSLPFFPAIQNPAATAEGMRPMADGMRAGMLASAEANLDVYRQQAHMALGNMSNQPERMATLVQWSDSSDPATTAAAMHDMMTTDLREALASIQTPTLVLGAWAGYSAFGATRESVEQTYRAQYAAHPQLTLVLSDAGYHFLMWDDPNLVQTQIRQFLALETR